MNWICDPSTDSLGSARSVREIHQLTRCVNSSDSILSKSRMESNRRVDSSRVVRRYPACLRAYGRSRRIQEGAANPDPGPGPRLGLPDRETERERERAGATPVIGTQLARRFPAKIGTKVRYTEIGRVKCICICVFAGFSDNLYTRYYFSLPFVGLGLGFFSISPLELEPSARFERCRTDLYRCRAAVKPAES